MNKRHLGILGIGLLANLGMTKGFDFILYPLVIYFFGVIWGGLIMIFLSFIICYLTILFYDWSKKDWLGVETMKMLKELEHHHYIYKFITSIIKKSDPIVMILLSIKFDPFITVIYMRHGTHRFNGLSRRDWKIFFSSLLIANIYWTVISYFGINILIIVWQLIRK